MSSQVTIPDQADTVVVPVTEDYRTAPITGLNIAGIVTIGNYIYGFTQAAASQIVKFDPADLTSQTVLTFPSDGKHIHATGIVFAPSKGLAYVTFANPIRLVIAEVNLTTMTHVQDVVDRAIIGSTTPQAIATDNTSLFVLMRASDTVSAFSKFALSSFAETTVNLSSYGVGSDLCVLNGKAYFVGVLNSAPAQRLLIQVNGTTGVVATGNFPTGLSGDLIYDIVPSSNAVWVSFRDIAGRVWKFAEALVGTTLTVSGDGDHVGLSFDSAGVWQLFSSGDASRINPTTSEILSYTLDPVDGYLTEVVGWGGNIYTLVVTAGLNIARYRIPIGGVSGDAKSARLFGGTIYSDQAQILSLARYQDGALAIAGRFNGNINIGGTTISNPSSASAAFLAVLNNDGTLRWVRSLASGAPNQIAGIAFDTDGDVIGCGSFQNSINLGGGVLTGSGLEVWVAKYASADGGYIWGSAYGGPNSSQANGLAITTAGDVAVTGYFQTSMVVGSDTLVSAGSFEGFLIKLNGATGTPIFAKRFGGTGDDRGIAVVPTVDGGVAVLGHFTNTADFSGTPKTATGGQDMFIAHYDEDGALIDVHTFGGTGYTYPKAIAINSDGFLAATGIYTLGTANFGGSVLPSTPTPAIFVVKFDANVNHVWSNHYGGEALSSDNGTGVAIDTEGIVYPCGTIRHSAVFNIPGDFDASDIDPWVAKLASSDGSKIWGRRYHGPSESDTANCIIVNEPEGEVIMGGQYSDTINFVPGSGILHGSGYTDAYLVRIAK